MPSAHEDAPLPTLDEAQAILERVLGSFYSFVPTEHAKMRGRQRRFDDQDAIEVLKSGSVRAVQRHDVTGDAVFVVAGFDTDGDSLSVVVQVFEEDSTIALLTGY